MEESPKRYTKDEIIRAIVDEYCVVHKIPEGRPLEVWRAVKAVVSAAAQGLPYEQTNKHQPGYYDSQSAQLILKSLAQAIDSDSKKRRIAKYIEHNLIKGSAERLFNPPKEPRKLSD